MLVNSFYFLIFFPLVCLVYYLLPKLWLRNSFLLVASYYFYMCWKPVFALLLVSVTLIAYTGGLCITRISSEKKKKWILKITIIANVSILFFYKYFNFVAKTITETLNTSGTNITVSHLDILMPIGISFFVFKAISYLVDIYRGKLQVEENLVDYSLYIAFFPQLLAGPIDRATNLLPQLKHKILFDGFNVSSGLKMMLWGYFMKVAVADRIATYVDAVYNNIYHHNGTTLLTTAVMYSFQIFCDFAGYSLISIGAAKTMGYNVPANFTRPYFAVSITDFWKRWHISLTSWLREYVYIPLGGNRCSKFRNYYNIFITFLVSGIWHGAAWNFMFWGGLHGLFQIIEKTLGLTNKADEMHAAMKVFRIIVTFFIATFAWIFFRLDINTSLLAISKIFTTAGPIFNLTGSAMLYSLFGLLLIFLKDYTDEYTPGRFLLFENKHIAIRYGGYLAVVFLILLTGVFDSSQFIYFQF